jgi:hypothetical protein
MLVDAVETSGCALALSRGLFLIGPSDADGSVERFKEA